MSSIHAPGLSAVRFKPELANASAAFTTFPTMKLHLVAMKGTFSILQDIICSGGRFDLNTVSFFSSTCQSRCGETAGSRLLEIDSVKLFGWIEAVHGFYPPATCFMSIWTGPVAPETCALTLDLL
jgi:hypothetical protein